LSRTPKWIRRQTGRPNRGTVAQDRDLRWLWRHRANPEANRSWLGEMIAGGICWHTEPGIRF